MIRRRSILVLTADLTPSDSNRRLVSLLDEWGRDGAIDPTRTRVIAGRGGALATDIAPGADLAAVRVVEDPHGPGSRAAAWVHPRLRGVGGRVDDAVGLARRVGRENGRPDLVWAHGAAALDLLPALGRASRSAPLIACVPEGPVGLQRAAHSADLRRNLARAAAIVTSTEVQRDHLADVYGVDPRRVVVSGDWRPRPSVDPRRSRRPDSVPREALLIGGAGVVGWRSGTDLFLDLARRLPAEIDGGEVHLAWIGPTDRPGDDARAAADIGLRGLDGRVHLLDGGDSRDPLAAGVDVMVVTARECPLPLGAIQAAGEGRAVLGLAGSGVEALAPDRDTPAVVVDPFDGHELTGRVESLLRDQRSRQLLGGSLRDHVRRNMRAEDVTRALWADLAGHLARQVTRA